MVHAWKSPTFWRGIRLRERLPRAPARFCFRTAQSYVKGYPRPFSYFERSVLARAQGWIAGASLVFEAMLRRGFPRETGRVLNLAVDLSAFHPVPAGDRAELLNQLGLEPPVVGYVGRFTKAKGMDILMQAMERVASSRPWSLLLLGAANTGIR